MERYVPEVRGLGSDSGLADRLIEGEMNLAGPEHPATVDVLPRGAALP